MKKGIDISYHQGDIDFNLVKNSGIDFVILREGYRNTTDKKFFEYVEQIKKTSLSILGVYHFSYALNKEEAIKEAELCVSNIKKADLGPDTMVFFDFEYDTVKKAAQKGVTLTKTDCNTHTVAFCEKVKELGYKTGVYTNIDYYKNWYEKDVLSAYPIWLADYKGDPDYKCILQQYTSSGSVSGINTNVDMNYYYGEDFKMESKTDKPIKSRYKVVEMAQSWLGKNEADGSYKTIIDTYNSYNGTFPRGVKMKYEWSWCACTWSAIAIALGYTDIMPIEISCGELIKRAQNMNCWKESDSYIPEPGDAVLYDWQDSGVGDNNGWPDHVGTIEKVDKNSKIITVIEGNYSNAVKRRSISFNSKNIRGFIVPRYDD